MKQSLPDETLFGESVRLQTLFWGRRFDYDQRLHRIEQDKGLGFVAAFAVNKRNIVIGNFADQTLVDGAGDGFNIDELAFVTSQ